MVKLSPWLQVLKDNDYFISCECDTEWTAFPKRCSHGCPECGASVSDLGLEALWDLYQRIFSKLVQKGEIL